jgi:hypothetical protein
MVLLSFGGCRPAAENEQSAAPKQALAAAAATVSKPPGDFEQSYALYLYAENYKAARYEPEHGHYIGADISAYKTESGDIRAFEEKTQTAHAIYASTMKLGEAYPYEWLLACVASQKTPALTIEPPDGYSPFQPELLEKTAREAGGLHIPMFVVFYPYSSEKGYKPARYVDFFREAKTLFETYAPEIALIWGVFAENVYDCFAYYPGDSAVDWVAMTIEQKIGDAETALYRPVMKDIDYFYYTFQKKKPIMLSLSVSHYSTAAMQYYTKEAAAEINKIYKAAADHYPRIKAAVYKSYNEIGRTDQAKTANEDGQNYLIGEEPFVLDAYLDGIGRDRMRGEFAPTAEGETKYEFLRSPFAVYEKDGAYYIAEKSLRYDLNLVGLNLLDASAVQINGERYFPLDALKKHTAFTVEIDAARERLTLEKQ